MSELFFAQRFVLGFTQLGNGTTDSASGAGDDRYLVLHLRLLHLSWRQLLCLTFHAGQFHQWLECAGCRAHDHLIDIDIVRLLDGVGDGPR
jgi:hypothetical protein